MLRLENVSKTFVGVRALIEVNLEVAPGEIHAVCGENGAGKSTLMKIIGGTEQADGGSRMFIEGKQVQFRNAAGASAHHIGVVFQERSLIDDLSVAENIYLNNYPVNFFGKIDYKKLQMQSAEILNTLEISDIKTSTQVHELSPVQMQMVQIAKALVRKPKVLILDEPTASVTEKETAIIFSMLRKLRRQGVAIIYISHRLSEIFEIADRVTVLKDGVLQGTFHVKELTEAKLIRLMVGRDLLKQKYSGYRQEEVILNVSHLSGRRFTDVSFEVRGGEIVALAGLIGAGRSEIAKTIFGYLPKLNGEVQVRGQTIVSSGTAAAIRKGIGYLAEDRKHQSVFSEMSVVDNLMATYFSGAGFTKMIDRHKTAEVFSSYKNKLGIVTSSDKKKIKELSGGNQQKIVLARWLTMNPKVLMVDEPTQGIDVGAKFEIYNLLKELAKQGTAILLVSSELTEVLALADRIIVIKNGKVSGELTAENATEEGIMVLATGVSVQPFSN